MSALADTLAALARVLDGQGLAWFVFGAQAVAVRGAPRATQDVDVTVQMDRSHLPELLARLQAAGLRHRYPDLADELIGDGAVLPLSHASGMEVDLVLAGSGLEALALARATKVAIDGEVGTGSTRHRPRRDEGARRRGKDLDDLQSLLASGEVDLEEARDLLGQLEEALAQSDLLPRFEQAITEGRHR